MKVVTTVDHHLQGEKSCEWEPVMQTVLVTAVRNKHVEHNQCIYILLDLVCIHVYYCDSDVHVYSYDDST